MSKRGDASHVVVRTGTEVRSVTTVGECLHCGEILAVLLPIRLKVFSATVKAFTNEHRGCRAPVPGGEQ